MPTIINEATRQDLLSKSKKGKATKTYGTNRFARRNRSSINASSRTYNQIDMNSLFKKDILIIRIPVNGETNKYEVQLKFNSFLDELRKETNSNKEKKCEYKTVAKALMRAFNRDDTYISCSCPDWKYRFAYWGSKDDYSSGAPQPVPAVITNPDNDLGAGCKHSLLVLANLKWAMKVATVINNYILYAKDNMQKAYADIIFPAIYGVKYDKAVQLGLFDTEEVELANTLDNEEQRAQLDRINKNRADSTKFRKGGVGKVNNQQPAFRKKSKDVQLSLDTEEEESE